MRLSCDWLRQSNGIRFRPHLSEVAAWSDEEVWYTCPSNMTSIHLPSLRKSRWNQSDESWDHPSRNWTIECVIPQTNSSNRMTAVHECVSFPSDRNSTRLRLSHVRKSYSLDALANEGKPRDCQESRLPAVPRATCLMDWCDICHLANPKYHRNHNDTILIACRAVAILPLPLWRSVGSGCAGHRKPETWRHHTVPSRKLVWVISIRLCPWDSKDHVQQLTGLHTIWSVVPHYCLWHFDSETMAAREGAWQKHC